MFFKILELKEPQTPTANIIFQITLHNFCWPWGQNGNHKSAVAAAAWLMMIYEQHHHLFFQHHRAPHTFQVNYFRQHEQHIHRTIHIFKAFFVSLPDGDHRQFFIFLFCGCCILKRVSKYLFLPGRQETSKNKSSTVAQQNKKV